MQYSADVLLHTVTLAHRLNTAPTLLALAACRLFINVLHASQITRRATVEEAAAVLDIVRQNIKSAKHRGGPKPRKPLEPKPIDVSKAFSSACRSRAMEDFVGLTDHFEAVALAWSAAKAGGHATLFRADDAVKTEQGVFQPLSPPLLRIHRNLKHAFDPQGVFNRGRMYPGL